jgi:aldehyde dehydrogenase (NAD+)
MRNGQLYIDGKWRDSASGHAFELLNPASEEVFASAADGTRDDMRAAIAAARRSFDQGIWRSTPIEERAGVLRDLAKGLRRRSAALTEIMVEGHGIDQTTLPFNLVAAVDNLDVYADAAIRFAIDTPLAPFVAIPPEDGPSMVANALVHRQPIGVCGLIPTWNFPLFISLNKIAPALAMGCSVVIKPSPLGPLVDVEIAKALDELGLPAGVVNVVTGQSPELGIELSESPSVDMIGFTGSAAVGRSIMTGAGSTLKRLHLELGGKSALLVCEDADLDRVAPVASAAACYRAGQACAHLTRILVPRGLHDALVSKMVAFVEGYARIGDPSDPNVTVGPLISRDRIDSVDRLVRTALEEGAVVACGGQRSTGRSRGFFYESTILSNVESSMQIAQEEVFGPVVCVMPYDDLDQAVEIANDCEYGLSGGIVTADTGRAIELAKRFRTGEVVINGGNHPYAPFGGFKQSGLGREMMDAGFESFTERQTISWSS